MTRKIIIGLALFLLLLGAVLWLARSGLLTGTVIPTNRPSADSAPTMSLAEFTARAARVQARMDNTFVTLVEMNDKNKALLELISQTLVVARDAMDGSIGN